jgi:hypothetical protein
MSVTGQTAIRELSRRNPVQLEEFFGSGGSPQAVAQLLRILATEPSMPHAFDELEAPRPTHGRVLVTAGVAIVAGAAAVASTLLPGTPGGPASAAAAALNHEATVAAKQAPAELPVGDYQYTKSDILQLATFGYGNSGRSALPGTSVSGPSENFDVLRQVTRQVWTADDGSGRMVEQFGSTMFPTTADRAAWLADGSPSLQPSSGTIDQTEGPGSLTVADLSALPTDPATLGNEIADRKVVDGPQGNAETFKIIGELLSETDASPALRGALYQVAAGLGGVTLVGAVTDSLGRSGTAVSYGARGETHELIFDPSTSSLLATEDTVTDPSQAGLAVPAGTVIGSTTYVVSSPVSSTSATASPDLATGK